MRSRELSPNEDTRGWGRDIGLISAKNRIIIFLRLPRGWSIIVKVGPVVVKAAHTQPIKIGRRGDLDTVLTKENRLAVLVAGPSARRPVAKHRGGHSA